MITFDDISVGEPKIVGTDPQFPTFSILEFPLDRAPPREWAEHFHVMRTSFSSMDRRLALVGSKIQVSCPAKEVIGIVEQVHGRVASANAAYRQFTLPELQLSHQRKEAEAAKRLETERATQAAIRDAFKK